MSAPDPAPKSPPQPAIRQGEELGPYRVGERIGAGGMGEVYKARDSRLEREVALKVLPANVMGDAGRRARFIREARAASRLNHPNTVTVYDIGEQDGRVFIAMELVAGKTLETVIPPGGLSLKDTLQYAVQITAALAKAHAAGIIHRDLKPGNIMITADGTVKVLDFGLAKLNEPPSAGPESSTLTAQSGTHAGMLLGTPAFMSPEQAEGKPVDARSDIFSLGSVLYQMATGKRAFAGDSVMSIVGAVLHKEPDPLPQTVAPELQKLILRCLKKDPERRFQSMADVRVSLEELREESGAGALSSATGPAVKRRPAVRIAALLLAVVTVLAAAVLLGMRLSRSQQDTSTQRTIRFTITPKQLLRGGGGQVDSEVSISQDGKRIAYVESQGGQLWIRDVDSEEAHPVPGATHVYQAFWSPDNRFIGYAEGTANCAFSPCDLVRIPVEGGTPILITKVQGFRRAAFSSDGETVLYASSPAGLFTVPTRGGTPTRVIEHPHLEHPSFLDLPGGRRAYLYQTAVPGSPPPTPHSVYITVVGENKPHLVVATTSTNPYPAYSSTGHIIYTDGIGESSTIWALPYSLAKLQATGKAFPIAQHAGSPMVSRTGALVYGDVPSDRWQLKWVDRSGATLSTIGEPQAQDGPSLSPDGRRLAVQDTGTFHDLWVYDLGTGTRMRFFYDAFVDTYMRWTPAGDEITFGSLRDGKALILSKAINGNGEPNLLAESPRREGAPDWSPGRKFLICAALTPQTKSQLIYRERHQDGTLGDPVTFSKTPFNETLPRFSPDGHFVAYVSDESGRNEIYVRDFPNGAKQWRISASGGTLPRWTRDGRQIFYMGRQLFAVSITYRPDFSPGVPAALFERKSLSPAYDVSLDGKRFVILDKPAGEAPLSVHVVYNWFAEFRGQPGHETK